MNDRAEKMNNAAMQIILHAGNCRELTMNALNEVEKNGSMENASGMIRKANDELLIAHREQTRIIQETIMDEEASPTLLFSHAQDTLMTIQSEYNLAIHLIKFYELLSK